MARKKTSSIWATSKTELEQIVKQGNSLSEILRKLDLDPSSSGSRFRSLKQRLEEDNIDYSHITLGVFSNQGRKIPRKAFPLEEVMVENSTYSRGNLKKRLLKNGMLENKCILCEQDSEHNGLKLVMVLDHINGVRDDNRYENLRMLCPNCNSQQETFAGKKNKRYYYCKKCNNEITKQSKSKLCKSCYGKFYVPKKVKDRPSKEQLIKEVEETNYCAVGRKYGVSDNCIRKWIK